MLVYMIYLQLEYFHFESEDGFFLLSNPILTFYAAASHYKDQQEFHLCFHQRAKSSSFLRKNRLADSRDLLYGREFDGSAVCLCLMMFDV